MNEENLKSSFSKVKYVIISGVLGLSITVALYIKNFIILVELNEYGAWGIIGFTLICLITFIVGFTLFYSIFFIVHKVNDKRKTNLASINENKK